MAFENLIRISTYAKSKGVSLSWAYHLAEKGKLKIVKIDGMIFVDIKNKNHGKQ